MIKGYQQKITELYEKIQEDEKKALRRRKEEIKLTVPEVMELDNEIQRLSIFTNVNFTWNSRGRA